MWYYTGQWTRATGSDTTSKSQEDKTVNERLRTADAVRRSQVEPINKRVEQHDALMEIVFSNGQQQLIAVGPKS